MTRKEFADWICNHIDYVFLAIRGCPPGYICGIPKEEQTQSECSDCWLHWFEKEVKNE